MLSGMSDGAVDAFLGTMDELAYTSRFRGGVFEATKAAGIVRRLLFDQSALFDAVADGFTPTFRVGHLWANRQGRTNIVWYLGGMLDAVVYEVGLTRLRPMLDREVKGLEATSVDKSGFSKLQVFQETVPNHATNTQDIIQTANVKDVVRYFANQLGGVHYGMESNPNPLVVEMHGLHQDVTRDTMLAIGRAVHHALSPQAILLSMKERGHPYDIE